MQSPAKSISPGFAFSFYRKIKASAQVHFNP